MCNFLSIFYPGKRNKGTEISLFGLVIPLALSLTFTLVLIAFLVYKVTTKRNHSPSSSEDSLLPKSQLLERKEQIYQGQFTQVWRGFYSNKNVAIKLFCSSPGVKCWNTEKDIYINFDLKHKNVVKFVYAEQSDQFHPYEHVLVTEYAEHTSLYAYLKTAPKLKFQLSLKLMMSFMTGLAFLHKALPNKPIIAHRDLKSQNVLVKAGDVCCIADFGLAVPLEDNITTDLSLPKTQVCCKNDFCSYTFNVTKTSLVKCLYATKIILYEFVIDLICMLQISQKN